MSVSETSNPVHVTDVRKVVLEFPPPASVGEYVGSPEYTYLVEHDLNTTDLIAQVIRKSDKAVVFVDAHALYPTIFKVVSVDVELTGTHRLVLVG